jgi:hypothetical protein
MSTTVPLDAQSFQVRFVSLYSQGRALAFPCDAQGRVDMDALTARAKDNYLIARAMVGRDYSAPCLCGLALA